MVFSNVADYRVAARRYLPDFAWSYLEGGAEDAITMRRNRAAYESIAFAPKVLVDVSTASTHTTLAGCEAAWPAVVGPTGLNGLYCRGAEEALARAAHAAGLPFALSTASTSLLEDVRAATDGDLWLQLYVQQDRRIAEDLMARAQAARFSTLLLTVDTPVTGQRDHYARTGFTLPLRRTPRLLWDIATHPRWLAKVGVHGVPQLVNLARSARLGPGIEAQAAALGRQMDTTLDWRDIAWLRKHWPGKIFIKGIQTVADAALAFRHEADGVVLSNHGGRQLDGAQSPVDILAHTAAIAPRGAEILVDGGIRRGSDIAKAVALGAKGVLLGRAPLYGLAARGQDGARGVLALLHKELDICMRLLGCTSVDALGADCLTTHGGAFAPLSPHLQHVAQAALATHAAPLNASATTPA
ncbi:alpha-hydroxy-acid oxidizing protein [Trinickia symbiotica]|uniref:Alpha-hydroxy-acid oxidizing protein n=1 Tax=Trinickia symbiotica TaxID=863227 RepID=A0A2T3XKL1_9BURK|nr:alpha-hydroxy acid oxidase [Trinickia symbiotica]PTB17071.1 alpha-hydroxy-acid oxidizing protein [Trinickia symbiotica]